MGSTRTGGRGLSRWRGIAAGAAVLVAAPTMAACGSESGKEINVYISPIENFQTVVDRCNQEAGGRYDIVYRKLPRDADGQREQMVRRLAAGDTSLDVLGLDVTWVPEFAEAEWLEEFTGQNKAEATEDVLPGPLETATWNDKLYAATMNTNVQLLWYDEAVVPEPPETWPEMIDMAKELKAQGKPHQILFTGAQYEGLVVQFNSLVESAGGKILSEDGKSVVMDEGAIEALRTLKDVTTQGITDPTLSTSQEQQVQLAMEAPDTKGAFEINWPNVYSAMAEANPERAKTFKWARYPGFDGPGKATIGGFNLAVSKLSENKPEAFEAVQCLRGEESQKFEALCDGNPPTIEGIYSDTSPGEPCPGAEQGADPPTMEATYPMKDTILEELKEPAVRPLTVVYQNLSTITSKVLSPPEEIDPESTAEDLRDGLQKALESKGVLP
jgi:multiple sugar transport system substrate-binding protein